MTCLILQKQDRNTTYYVGSDSLGDLHLDAVIKLLLSCETRVKLMLVPWYCCHVRPGFLTYMIVSLLQV